MARVTNFTVRFHRNMQPAKYEEAGAIVEFSGVVEEGDDADAITAERLTVARRQVLAAVGKGAAPEAEAAPAKPKSTRKPAGKKAEKKADAPAAEADPLGLTDDDKPKADTKGGVVPAEDDDVLGLGTETPEAPAEEEEPLTDTEFHNEVRKHAARLTGAVVKKQMEEWYKVEVLSAIDKGKRREFLSKLEGVKAEG